MTATASVTPNLASQLVNSILAIKPLADLARSRARAMMIQRAESVGVSWIKEVAALKARDWNADLARIQNPQVTYPEYYLAPFHAYDRGNLDWDSALEVEVAAHAVHARIWPEAGAQGDSRLRQSYHEIVKAALPEAPQDILDVGCSVGMSTFALQATYPKAQMTGIDLSHYFLAVANYRTQQQAAGERSHLPTHYPPNPNPPRWLHAVAESTGLPDACFDLVSCFLLFHELPQDAAVMILQELRRLLRPGGHLTIMDMNPQSEIYAKMPAYILTLLKSTEPYLDDYFALDIEHAIATAGFHRPTITCNSPRHRTIIARVGE